MKDIVDSLVGYLYSPCSMDHQSVDLVANFIAMCLTPFVITFVLSYLAHHSLLRWGKKFWGTLAFLGFFALSLKIVSMTSYHGFYAASVIWEKRIPPMEAELSNFILTAVAGSLLGLAFAVLRNNTKKKMEFLGAQDFSELEDQDQLSLPGCDWSGFRGGSGEE